MMSHLIDLISFEKFPHVDKDFLFSIRLRLMEYSRLSNIDAENVYEAKVRLIKARRCFNSALIIIKQTLEPEDNKYIRENKKIWDWMVDNTGRFEKRLDAMLEKMSSTTSVREDLIIKNSKGKEEPLEYLDTNSVSDSNAMMKLQNYRRELDEAIEHLIYYPIKRAISKFMSLPEHIEDINKKIVKKDKAIFNFFIFAYMFHASNTLGGLAREEEPKSIRNLPSSSYTTSASGMGRMKSPLNKEDSEVLQDDIERLNNFFSMPDELRSDENEII